MADAALVRLSLAEAADGIRRRALSPVELAEAVLAQIDALNPTLNAFITLVPREQVLAAARAAEREIAAGAYRGLLHGIPVSVKDLIDTAGLRTSYGSGMFRDHVPEKDGGVPERLRAAGAIITGKTATHELGQGMTTNNHFFGPTRNPWNLEHVPGGSSGGAGAAAAALMGPLHIGTDGGGSIRFPAAFCGVTGLKPTLGLISNRGQFGGAGTSFSVPGPLTRTVRDAALAAQALAGFDPEHLYSRPGPAPDLIGGRPRVFGPQVQRIMEITPPLTVPLCVRTQQRRQLVARDYQAAFVEADVLVAPVAPMPAPRIDTDEFTFAPLCGPYCGAANLAGIPSVPLPAGTSGGLPVAIQIIAPARADALALRVAYALGPAAPGHRLQGPAPAALACAL